jgi:hypothetical protein
MREAKAEMKREEFRIVDSSSHKSIRRLATTLSALEALWYL